jgi:hypothetical protein
MIKNDEETKVSYLRENSTPLTFKESFKIKPTDARPIP